MDTVTCNLCVNNCHYITGDDEYPARTCIAYCSKGHWENSDPSDPEMDSVVNCPDFQQILIAVAN